MNDYGFDMDEVTQVIDTAEVLIVRFAILDKRLLIDARCNEQEGPIIAIVPRVGSVEERFKSLKKMRPRFSLPDKIMSFLWPRQMETFRSSGLWAKIEARMVSLGGEQMAEQCLEVFAELARQEKAEMLAAIRGGDTYQSLWERSD